MITSKSIYELATSKAITNNMVVVCPYDHETIEACLEAIKLNLCSIIFVGEKEKIFKNISKEELVNNKIVLYETLSDELSAMKAMELISNKEGNILMKGLIDTSLLLKTLLKKEYDLCNAKLLSHVGLLTKEGKKTYIVTDCAMNIAPTLEDKIEIINNSVNIARKLGLNNPYVGNLCAKEKYYEKMPATVDASKLKELNENGIIKNCVVSGPLQMDNMVSEESCAIKGVTDKVCGKVDIIVAHTIETANALAKGLKYLGGYDFSGILVGAKVPVVLVSRADNFEEKLLSIAISCCF